MVERRSWIPMEDGVRLAVSLYMPDSAEAGEPVPVVLEALPYRKDDATASYRPEDATASYRPEYERLYSEFGYAVAHVDLRERGRRRGLHAAGRYICRCRRTYVLAFQHEALGVG